MKRILAIILLTLTICSCEASKILKTNTAVVLAVGPFVDFSDGVTPETAMTVTNITMELYKETDEGSAPTRAVGVNPTASGGSNDMVHITSDVAGFYSIELTAAQLNFLGRATIVFTDADVCLPVFVPITVVSDQIYSSLIEDDDELQVHTSEITGDLITASVIAADAIGSSELAANSITSSEIADDSIDAGAIAADSIGASELAADAVGSSEIGTGAIDADSIAADAIGASELAADAIASSELATTAVTEIQTGLATETNVDANETKIDTLTTNVGTVDTVVDAIKLQTDQLNFTGTDVKATLDGETVTPGAGSITATVMATDSIGSDEIASTAVTEIQSGLATAAALNIVSASVNGLEGSSAPSAATIADAVWDEAIAGHASAGSTGSALSGASAPSAATVADAVWDEATSGHQSAGTTGLALTNASSPTATQIRDAILAASINQTTLEEAIEWLYTWAVGSFVKSGSAVTYKDSLGTTVFSFNIGSSSRTHGE